jgi:hypothetical protein
MEVVGMVIPVCQAIPIVPRQKRKSYSNYDTFICLAGN